MESYINFHRESTSEGIGAPREARYEITDDGVEQVEFPEKRPVGTQEVLAIFEHGAELPDGAETASTLHDTLASMSKVVAWLEIWKIANRLQNDIGHLELASAEQIDADSVEDPKRAQKALFIELGRLQVYLERLVELKIVSLIRRDPGRTKISGAKHVGGFEARGSLFEENWLPVITAILEKSEVTFADLEPLEGCMRLFRGFLE